MRALEGVTGGETGELTHQSGQPNGGHAGDEGVALRHVADLLSDLFSLCLRVEAEDAGVHVMDAAQDSEDPQVFFIEMHGTLPAGSYTVSWRGMGEDGHVVRDTFEFSVATQ